MKKLKRNDLKKISGGKFYPGGGTCTSTCWAQSTGGDPLGSVSVPDCEGTNASKCKDSYPAAVKATCSCGTANV